MHENFFHKLKVYYEDTDSGGVVYYANYLKFLERARTEALFSIGYSNKKIKENSYSIIFLDVNLPDGISLDYLEKIINISNNTSIVIMTAQDSMENAINSMKLGAYDYIPKPIDLNNDLLLLIERGIKNTLKNIEISQLKTELIDSKKEDFQTNAIIDAMLSTGNGVEKETCIYVINVTNEYELISIFGFSFGGEQSLIEGRYDYLAIEENPYEIEGLYFDVSRSLNALKF